MCLDLINICNDLINQVLQINIVKSNSQLLEIAFTCNIQQATETEFHSTYTIKVGQSLDNLVNLDEYLESNGNHEALQMWQTFLNYTGLQI